MNPFASLGVRCFRSFFVFAVIIQMVFLLVNLFLLFFIRWQPLSLDYTVTDHHGPAV